MPAARTTRRTASAKPAPEPEPFPEEEDETEEEVEAEGIHVFSRNPNMEGIATTKMYRVVVKYATQYNQNGGVEVTIGEDNISDETMTYDQQLTAIAVACNDAVTQIANTMGLDTAEMEDGTLRFKEGRKVAVEKSEPAKAAYKAGGARKAGGAYKAGGARKAGGSARRSGSSRPHDAEAPYDEETIEAMWTLFGDDPDVFFDDLSKQYPAIKPKFDAFKVLGMDVPEKQDIKPLYLKHAPDDVKEFYEYLEGD